MLAGDSRWWDITGNPFSGCRPVSDGCRNCYAAQQAGTLHQRAGAKREVHPRYEGIAKRAGDGRFVFNGEHAADPSGDRSWTFPLTYPGADHPLLGPGQPSLIFVGSMADLFFEERSEATIDRVVGTIVLSKHIGQLLTRRTARMEAYFTAAAKRLNPYLLRRYQQKLWLGFSASHQREFDVSWPHVRPLAEAGWTVFVSLAPLLERVKLPVDFLKLGSWVIVSGEQGRLDRCRDLDPDWARAVRDQCKAAGVAFFMKQMSGRKPIPPDLFIRQFPKVSP
jgi:protein gp37